MLEYAAKNEAEKTNTYGANGRYTQAYNSGYNYNMLFIVKDRQGITHLTLRLNKRSIPDWDASF